MVESPARKDKSCEERISSIACILPCVVLQAERLRPRLRFLFFHDVFLYFERLEYVLLLDFLDFADVSTGPTKNSVIVKTHNNAMNGKVVNFFNNMQSHFRIVIHHPGLCPAVFRQA